MTQTPQPLTQAAQSAQTLTGELRAALTGASAVAGLQLLELIRSAADLAQRIEALSSAMQADHAADKPRATQ